MKRGLIFLLVVACLCTGTACSSVGSVWEEQQSLSLREQMETAMESGAKILRLQGDFTEEELKGTYRELRAQRPDLFWLGNSWEGTVETSPVKGTTVTLEPSYYGEQSENLRNQKRLLKRAESLAEQCREKKTVYEQLLFLHDAIVNSCRYDQESADILTKNPDTQEVLLSTTAYGCLMEGKAVCSGYAAALALVLRQLSIPCRRVTGMAKGQLHEWNLVQVEGQWCHVDLTWDDPTTQSGEDTVIYDYFCVSDESILLTHVPDKGQSLPDCSTDAYGWFEQNGMTVEECTLSAVADCVQKQIEDGRERYFVKFAENAAQNVFRVTEQDFLRDLQKELGVRLKSYRLNSLNNAVELIPAQDEGEK